ncbi:MAG: energy-coupling factor transporter ATPase [Candidatus Paraimprobicoccus trichonymphae]|uniref:Energy-coupling factor transporter ATPase n=1 Tax=Candidatus Paraimprobicoccus trichonymphae TaxID=3033793 RepID=A0AA48I392_9FIRM|nr:MAG: energy-coupling factor transporter ATPase [Candidatus Paraimprobicoccus trichonymphae]
MSILKIEDLSYKYEFSKINAIDNINFKVDKTEIIGLIGHTGSGKSTFVQLLNGILKPTSGEIFLNDVNIKNIENLYSKIGIVFQNPENQLFSDTVYNDISFGLEKLNLNKQEVKNRVCDSLKFVNLSKEILEKNPFELSGGQKRKVALAGVFCMEPEILVLDEPTSSLDPISKKLLIKNIINYKETKKNIVIFITHNMEEVAKISDRILVMSKGKFVSIDTPEKIFSEPEKLKNLNLEIPQITQIMINLNNQNYKIKNNIINVENAVNILLDLYRKNY